MSVNEALGNYSAVTGDLIKSQYEFAYYDNSIGWTGSLTNMKPTMGYMLKSGGTSSFTYPLSSFVGRQSMSPNSQTVGQTLFAFNPEMYDNTMSVIVNGNICNEALDQGNVAIGAFDSNNTLRGYAYPIKNNATNVYNFYLTLYSSVESEPLHLSYFNTTDGSTTPTTHVVSFAANGLMGTPSNPVAANVDEALKCNVVGIATGVTANASLANVNVYPNPFSDNLMLNFNQSVNCNIDLVDVLGKTVYSASIKNKKEFNMVLDANKTTIAAGMYYLRLTGGVNQQIKVIKTK
jgi:hypothetical protein